MTPLARYASLLLRYLRPQWPKVLLLSLLLLASTGLQLMVPQILRFFIDTAAASGELHALTAAALLFLGVGLGYQLLSAGATYLGADVGWTATNGMRADLAEHCLELDMRFHNARTPGELIERVDGDITALSTFFSVFTVRVVGSVLLLGGVLVLLWLENTSVGAALTGFTGLVTLALVRSRELAVPATRSEREANAQLFGFVEERLSGLDDLRANGAGAFTMRRFAEVNRVLFFEGRRAWMMRALIWLLTIGLFTGGTVLSLALGIHFYLAGAVTLGTAYLFVQYVMMLEAPIEQITQQLQELQKAAASIARVDELMRTPRRVSPGGAALPPGPLAVAFEGVSFAYEGDKVLNDVSFSLAPGEVLGLLGRTGSGKSTLSRLLFGLYHATEGRVRVGGVDVRDADPASLRDRVGMVTQQVQLFHASLRDNLSFFDPHVSDARIAAVLEELGLGAWLAGLPDGLDTMLLASGSGLSAGESQLLAFARVFLKEPGLVILDEPSSRLDPATEALLARATAKLLQARSAIIIAHRLQTVARADAVMVMRGGRVLEHGPRARLARDPRSHVYRLSHQGQTPGVAFEPSARKELA